MSEPFADALNAVNKYVVSRTLESTDAWRNSTVIRDDVVDSIRAMKQQPGKNILLDGSSVLAHTLIENDLVDELMLHIYPISLGSGKKLYPDGKRLDLKLVESSPLPTGVVYARYRRAEGK
jgi:dihydrofolate reductase